METGAKAGGGGSGAIGSASVVVGGARERLLMCMAEALTEVWQLPWARSEAAPEARRRL